MTYRICQVVFSTNRLEYLAKTLKSQRLLDSQGCQVTKILFDDYPQGRCDATITALAKSHGYELQLHEKNQGITGTWQHLFDIVKQQEFDYIWHQEDDAEILHPVKFQDLIEILQTYPLLSQVQLKRNNWYAHETQPVTALPRDTVFKNYRIEHGNPYFWMMASFYPAWIAREYDPVLQQAYPSESTLANFMLHKLGSQAGLLKTHTGNIMVNHFGEYSRGQRVRPGEPGWESFQYIDPRLDYNSRTGARWLAWQ